MAGDKIKAPKISLRGPGSGKDGWSDKSSGSGSTSKIEGPSIRVKPSSAQSGSTQDARMVSRAYQQMQRALHTSSGGSSSAGISKRSRGAMSAATSRAAQAQQRVAVRCSYAANKADGTWGAHGRYIERESASLEQEIQRDELAVQRDRATEQDRGDIGVARNPATLAIDQGANDDRQQPDSRSWRDRYGVDRLWDRASARFADAGVDRKSTPAQPLHGLPTLSGSRLAQQLGRLEGVLQGHARDLLQFGRPESAPGVRRGGPGEPGARGDAAGPLSPQREAASAGNPAGRGFSAAGDRVDVTGRLEAWQAAGDQRLWKLIVSPEFGDRLDLRAITRETMAAMERDLGTKLDWAAVDHYNTDNPHVHVVVRGVDDRGHQLEINPEYIKSGMRQRAAEVATRHIGYRTERDIADARERQIGQQRFTDLDRTLLRQASDVGLPGVIREIERRAQTVSPGVREISFATGPSAQSSQAERDKRLAVVKQLTTLEARGVVQRVAPMRWRLPDDLAKHVPAQLNLDYSGPIPASQAARDGRLAQIRRLNQLERMGLASRTGPMSWSLHPSLESALRATQKASDRLKSLAEARAMLSDHQAQLVTTELTTPGQRIVGRLIGTGLDESAGRGIGTPYALIEGVDGKVHYVLQPHDMQRQRGGGLRVGDYVALEVAQERNRTVTRATGYGASLPVAEIDRVIMDEGRTASVNGTEKTVAGAWRSKVAQRTQELAKEGVIEQSGGSIKVKDERRYDEMRFAEAGMQAQPVDPSRTGILAQVEHKGRVSLAVRNVDGAEYAVSHEQLREMRLDPKYTSKGAHILITRSPDRPGVERDHTGKPARVAQVITDKRLPELIADRRTNALDTAIAQVNVPAGHPLRQALDERARTWQDRGVDIKSPSFGVQANVWRINDDRSRRAAEKGMDAVMTEMGKERQLPTRSVQMEVGARVSGRVLATAAEQDGSRSVLIDAGGELVKINQPAAADSRTKAQGQDMRVDDLRQGQRVRATVEERVDPNGRQRLQAWRFADMEREIAIKQDKAKGRERF